MVLGVLSPVRPANAAYMIPGGSIRPKDFTLVKRDGVYHLFFIVNDVSKPVTEQFFGHQTSTDLYHWTPQPKVFAIDTTGWDNVHVWAPHIVQRDGQYWMFYTGVSEIPGQYHQTQRIGLAVSTDLVNWTRVGNGPIYSATQVPWAWSKPLSVAPAFRDPFVMPDPTTPGAWLMYFTASLAADTASTVVGVARSTGDFTQWTDVKPLLETWSNYSFNPLTESPHLFSHNGLWYLFITTSSGQPLTFYTGPNPLGEPAEWTYRGRLRNMLGFDTSTWFASESFRDGTHDLFLFVSGDRIEVRDIQWSSTWSFALLQPPLQHVFSITWRDSAVASGQIAQATLVTVNPLAGIPTFEVVRVDSLGGETPVPSDSVGFFPSPTLFGDTTVFNWTPRRWPRVPDTDTVTVTRYRMRTVDQTAESGILTVGPPAPPAITGIDPPGPDPDPAPQPQDWRHTRGSIRGAAPWGAGGVVLDVQLSRSAPVRVDLYDLAGRRVRALLDRSLPGGTTRVAWDGRDEAGLALSRGIYFARLTLPAGSATARVFLAAH